MLFFVRNKKISIEILSTKHHLLFICIHGIEWRWLWLMLLLALLLLLLLLLQRLLLAPHTNDMHTHTYCWSFFNGHQLTLIFCYVNFIILLLSERHTTLKPPHACTCTQKRANPTIERMKWRWKMCKAAERLKNVSGWVCVQVLGSKNYAHKIGVQQMHDISTLWPQKYKKKEEKKHKVLRAFTDHIKLHQLCSFLLLLLLSPSHSIRFFSHGFSHAHVARSLAPHKVWSWLSFASHFL